MTNSGVAGASKQATSEPAESKAGFGMFRFGGVLPGLRAKRTARQLYAGVVSQARAPVFYREFRAPDTADGRFELIIIHAFLLMHRFRGERGMTRVSRALSEELVTDVDRNLREAGIGDLSIGRQVRKLTGRLYQRLGIYTDLIEADLIEGASVADTDAGPKTLEEALRQSLYADADDPGTERLAALATYIRREFTRLAVRPAAEIAADRDPFHAPDILGSGTDPGCDAGPV